MSTPAWVNPPVRRRAPRTATWGAVVGVIALIAAAIYVFTGSTGVSGDRAEGAYRACERAVATNLHLAGDATFSQEAVRTRDGDTTAIVTGRVIGNSAAGTVVVTGFSCLVTRYPTGEWGAPAVDFRP